MPGTLQKLLGVVSRVREAGASFTNPVFRNYFVAKADEELRLLQEKGSSFSSTELENRLRLNSDLESILKRQSAVHNLYYNKAIRVEK
ncbi:complex 1 LYR family protein, putative [Babesia ovis]|uniref:Complex 1 LYR family protein, putative n=1 Tax=Babesia ovis TaxID=5869 RepID=A0A9W5T9M3_BABOV|nr:complex 1 LYR family protein, putative [Babesia ovis]